MENDPKKLRGDHGRAPFWPPKPTLAPKAVFLCILAVLGFTLASVLAPFGSLRPPFNALCPPFGSLRVPFGGPLASFLTPFASLLAAFGSLWLQF